MPRETLVDFFADLAKPHGEFLISDDGYRTRRYSYRAVHAAALGFAARLQAAGLERGDRILVWSENRAEWVAAFWGCVLAGGVVVPIDYRSSADFARRVIDRVRPRVALLGDEVAATCASVPGPIPAGVARWELAEFDWTDARRPALAAPARDDVVEIIFTSGATSEPKGVVITHRNILANIVPIEREIMKYRRFGRPVFPLRFLNLLPLSHMFGQALATFIPPLLPGTVAFMRGYNPSDIVGQIRRRRVSVLVSVPKILDVLREHVAREHPGTLEPLPRPMHVSRRWWRYRSVHRAFGPKFWAFIVGAAPLDSALEEYWSRLGFLVIQGYGLTETAPIVTLNHPFAARKGSVGRAIGDIEVRIAPDGEILVRGDNVSRGYFGDEGETGAAFEDGWLHTGDIGEIDDQRRLFVRGRKKEMIVTPEGLNVFPEDVERVIDTMPGVHESAVVGVARDGEERVHAVLRLDPGADADAVVREANARLADHQRIRGSSIWPGSELPRTDGTRKLKRGEIRRWVETGGAPAREASPARGGVEALLERFASGRAIGDGTTIEELGLSSLDRVELMVALEERLGAPIDEARFAEARTVEDLRHLQNAAFDRAGGWRMPAWNRGRIVTVLRAVSLATWVLPIARLFARVRVEGAENLRAVSGPVVFASNHQSHMDTPAILIALPRHWRYGLAVAMAKEFFAAHFHPDGRRRVERLGSSLLYYLASFFFNAFPLPQREAGTRRTLRYIGDLLSEGWSVLVFPEGERSATGAIGPFKPGVGMIGSRLAVPIVPVCLAGVDRVLHRTWRMARPGPVRVRFGVPLVLSGQDHAAAARLVEEAVRRLDSQAENSDRAR